MEIGGCQLYQRQRQGIFLLCLWGGGSSMGYKLAGFDVIGCNEIDHRMMYTYCQNNNPRFPFLEPIQTFKERQDLPPELFNLDILDGSPPCSTFSMAGSREDAWGKLKHFREGQAEQVLDTLFFDFIDLAKKLQPKVVVAENVKGLVLGNAKDYVRRIYQGFEDAGYYVKHFLLDAQQMGVPQRRERVFFLCLRKDIASPVLVQDGFFDMTPRIEMEFNEKPILFREVADYSGDEVNSKVVRTLWENRQYGDTNQGDANFRLYGKGSNFNQAYVYTDKICPTLASKKTCLIHFDKPLYLGQSEVCCISSFPQDYNFAGQQPHYVCGMSVPPVMMAQVASRIYDYWLSKI